MIGKVTKYAETGFSVANIYQFTKAGDTKSAIKETTRLAVKTGVGAALDQAATKPHPYVFGFGVAGKILGVDDKIADFAADTLGERMEAVANSRIEYDANKKKFLEKAAKKGMSEEQYREYLKEKYPSFYPKTILHTSDLIFSNAPPSPEEVYLLPNEELEND